MPTTSTTITHIECSQCGLRPEAGQPHNLCTSCASPLLVRYDLDASGQVW